MILFSNCSKNSKSLEEGSLINVNLENSEKGNFSELAASIEYVILKTPESHPLVWPHNLKIDRKGNIYLRDITVQQLLVFDHSGDFMKAFSAKGMGPKEYFQISDFQVSDDKVIILDTSINKIIEFDHSGKFIKEYKFNNKFFTFYPGKDFVLNFSSFSPEFDQYNFVKTILPSGEWEGFVKIPKEKLNIGNFDFPTGFMANFHDKNIYYNIPFSTQVAQFNSVSGDYLTLFDFDFGKFMMPNEYYKLGRSEMYELQEEKNLVRQINAFFPYKDFYFLQVSQGMGRKNHYLLLDSDRKIIFQKFNLVNDLDHMKVMGSPWSFSKDEIIYMVSSNDFLNEYHKIFDGKEVINTLDTIHQFVIKNEQKLKDDTKVLVKLKLKDFY